MSEDHIRYDILAQEALRSVIRKVLEEVSRAGLPGEHHFFITFQTDYPGVRLSRRMAERYPEEMTIVIQHTFWNLEVGDNAFEIDLSFDDIRERLRVPYGAIRGFFDPSVKFGLQFDVTPVDNKAADNQTVTSLTDGEGEPRRSTAGSVPEIKRAKPAAGAKSKASKSEDKSDGAGNEEESGAEVVSLDTFRKKK